MAEADIISVQIRPDVIVRLHGIPHDFTKEEAERVSRVVLAYAVTVPLVPVPFPAAERT